ncbi:NADH:quinone oxidoreductase [Pseudomonas guariconensis]|uniref:Rnf-Nqr domain containing protein n=1 Tax=Pseudomonas TaxID=286 RepID=UPI001CE3DF45|nr:MULTISPECIES: Rnf-Nqr domain containing protein [Pseudomonas]MCO7634625.1 NADH:quinone oxidoreductase [Pseudomonas guariconensis]
MNRFWLPGISLVPLLGATSTLAQAITIGLSTLVLMVLHQGVMAPLRASLTGAARLLASLLLLAALASCLQLGLRAWALPLALTLGHYPALLSVQCLAADCLLPDASRWRYLAIHLAGLLALYVLLGACRQWLTLGPGLHLASLAPGGLILLGLLLALYNCLRPGPAPSRRQGSL